MNGLILAATALDLQMFRDDSPGALEQVGAAIRALPPPTLLAGLAAALGFALGVWAAIDLVRRRRAAGGPMARRFAAALGLSPPQRRLIARLARQAKLRTPAAAMLSEGCFDAMVSRATASPREKIRIEELRVHLFGRAATLTG